MRLIIFSACLLLAGCQSTLRPPRVTSCTILIADDAGRTYCALTRNDRMTNTLVGPVLIPRTDTRPASSTAPLGTDGVYAVLYPRGGVEGKLSGKKSIYQSKPGEMVVYSYHHDTFTSLGVIPEGASSQSASSTIEAILRTLIRADVQSDQQPTPAAANGN